LQVETLPEKIHSKSVVIIAGPTGVGKTAVAIELAKSFKTEIISADSRQCFKELNIGVARPSEEELKSIPHHFITSHSIHDKVDAAVFEEYALQKLTTLFEHHDTVVMTGGTGLYIKAFCEGLDVVPAVLPGLRNLIQLHYKEKGIGWLQQEISEKDPGFFATGEIQNPQRLMRALEIVESTGQSVLTFRKGARASRAFNILKVGLELPKEDLHQHINNRVDKMMVAGLVNEVEQLQAFRTLNALQSVGYAEIFDFLDNNTGLKDATELIKKNTRQYAKRQMTWFRKDSDFKWFHPAQLDQIRTFAAQRILRNGLGCEL
jgi:tRNA dimethylallyltransferase